MSKVYFEIDTGVDGVRLAQKEDEAEIFGLLLMMHREIGLFTLNREKALDAIQLGTEHRGGLIYVIEADDRVVATMGMNIVSDWYSDDEYLAERWNFVHPEYRRSDFARRLVEQGKWASEWFRRRGKLIPFCCGIYTLDRTEAKIRLYARHLACMGAFFMYGAPPRHQDLMAQEMDLVEETGRKARRERSKEVSPTAEAVIRVGIRERDQERDQERDRESEHV